MLIVNMPELLALRRYYCPKERLRIHFFPLPFSPWQKGELTLKNKIWLNFYHKNVTNQQSGLQITIK